MTEKIREKLSTCISPLDPSEHKDHLVNIVTGKVAPDSVNVEQAYNLGFNQVAKFINNLPKGFYRPQTKSVVTMETMKKSIKIGDIPFYDTNLIYSRIIALQISRNVSMSDVLKFELAPIPTSTFLDSEDMRSSGSKSVLKNKLSISLSERKTIKPQALIIDGCAILWILNWPTSCQVKDFVSCFTEMLRKLQSSDVYLVFDR